MVISGTHIIIYQSTTCQIGIGALSLSYYSPLWILFPTTYLPLQVNSRRQSVSELITVQIHLAAHIV